MSFDVVFLNKVYTFPNDILTYIEILNLTEDIYNALNLKFLKKINSPETSFIDDEYLHGEMKKQAERFIQRLCQNEIYDKTADEYVFENNAYKLYSELNQTGKQVAVELLREEMENFRDGMNNAKIKAESNITGSGFQVYTSSFLTLAATSAMEYSTLKKQAQVADKQYRNEVRAISDSGEQVRNNKQNEFLSKTYIPNMEKILSLFAFDMMDRYIRHMTEAKKFDAEALNYVNIKKSQGLLENLKHTQNKSAVYEQAFIACPYNENLYLSILDTDLFDIDIYKTATTFKQDNAILSRLKSRIYNIDCQNNLTSAFKYIEEYVDEYAMCSGNSKEDIFHSLAYNKYNSVISGYDQVKDLIKNNSKLISVTESNADTITENKIYDTAKATVKSIISNDDLETLINKCGYPNLLKEISPSNQPFSSKSVIDDFYINELSRRVTEYVNERKDEINNEKELQEAIAKETAEKKKQSTIAAIIAVVLIIMAIIYVKAIKPAVAYHNGLNDMESKNYTDAIAVFEELGEYSDSKDMILECNYRMAKDCWQHRNYDDAISLFTELHDYSDSENLLKQVKYDKATTLLADEQYEGAIKVFTEIENYKDSTEYIKSAYFKMADKYYSNCEYHNAIEAMKKANPDNTDFFDKCYYKYGEQALERKDYKAALDAFTSIKNGDYSEEIKFINGMMYYTSGNYISALGMAEKCKNPNEELISNCLDKLYDLNEEAIKSKDYKTMIKYSDILYKYNYKDSCEKYDKFKEIYNNVSGNYICFSYTGKESDGKDAYLKVNANYRLQSISISFYPYGKDSHPVATLSTAFKFSGSYKDFTGSMAKSLRCNIYENNINCSWGGEIYKFKKE